MTVSSSRPSAGTVSPQYLAYLDEHMERHISSGRPAGALNAQSCIKEARAIELDCVNAR
jgi:hypothetical protein